MVEIIILENTKVNKSGSKERIIGEFNEEKLYHIFYLD